MEREGQWINQIMNEPVTISNWKEDDKVVISSSSLFKTKVPHTS
jgi:hypothetical protein